jgi:tetratricopeptide (TPR) repeat protein
MSLKENVSYIKQEISTQEQFFENFFKLEKFYRKYKLYVFGLIAIIIGFAVIIPINNYLNEQNLIKANEAYNRLLTNPKDKLSLSTLKETNQKLLNIALYQTSLDKTKANDIEFLKDIISFNKAVKQNDIQALNSLILKSDFVLKDFALFNKALILSTQGKYPQAKKALKSISDNSPITSLALMLKHYLLTK